MKTVNKLLKALTCLSAGCNSRLTDDYMHSTDITRIQINLTVMKNQQKYQRKLKITNNQIWHVTLFPPKRICSVL
jgi:hypothetical protein